MKIVSKILFTLFFCIIFLFTKTPFIHQASAAANTLYGFGILFDTSTKTNVYTGVLSIDPATYTGTPVGDDLISLGDHPGFTYQSAYDPIGHRFFAPVSNDNGQFFVTFNTQTGTFSSIPTDQGTIVPSISSYQYDPGTSTLYGLGTLFDTSTKTRVYVGVLAIDPTTYTATPVGDDIRSLGDNPSFTYQSAYDPVGHRFFAPISNDNGQFFLTFNTQTGTFSAVPSDQATILPSIGSYEYDAGTGILYGFGTLFDSSTKTNVYAGVLAIDPNTYIGTPVGDDIRSLGDHPGFTYQSAYDPIGHRLFAPVSNDNGQFFVTFNTQAGTFSAVPSDQATILPSIGSYEYDAAPVANTAPSVEVATINPNPAQINTPVAATTTFTDPDAADTHTATINWGDGVNTDEPCLITAPGSVTCTLPSGYSAANVYPVVITVSDGTDTGNSPTAYASVYQPVQGSIFSAGQRFSNPATAYPNNNGNVTFGLSYKYQGGMPQSIRQFSMDFNAANIHFNANNVDSLVVSNGVAILTGTGTKNGQTGFKFFVTGVNGGGIHIQITDPANMVIYDTQPGAPITATPTTTVTGHVVVQ